ncbi:bifunctional diguanylate cyclase/phosphodiesterase [Brevibacillus sp. H7]|uniref:bifunctional diguanylate cyclase/phosphodiesterase n=1 Tax=Brevibacillus sp. H7 TaxID=3349138 RepID=UPI003825A10F
MTLRKKTIATIGITTAGLLIILYLASLLILLGSFSWMEEKDTREDMRRVLNSFSAGVEDLVSTSRDYATRDDTYAFIQDANVSEGRNHPFVTRNFPDETFAIHHINFLLLLNAKGDIVYQKGYDMLADQEVPVSPELIRQIHQRQDLFLRHTHHDSSKSGLLILEDKPAAVASLPIIRSDKTGPIRGTLIAGYYIDSHYVKYQSALTRNLLQLSLYKNTPIPVEAELPEGSVWISEKDENKIQANALVYDLYGNPAFVLQFEKPRSIYFQGKSSLLYYLASLMITGIIFTVVILYFLEKVILSRLSGLITSIKTISQTKDFSARVRLTGTDEISDLEQEFNVMMSVLEESQGTIMHRAYHDFLTDLPNRNLFYEQLEQALETAARQHHQVAILFIGLDKFKQINDTFGHEVGDLLLLMATQRLLACIRSDDFLSRLGGDEFIVLLPSIAERGMIDNIADRIRESLSEPFHLKNHQVYASASIGISIYPSDGTDPEILIKHADMAMRRVKREGKNNYRQFTPDMQEETDRKLLLEHHLRLAVERNELQLYYQPKVCMHTGRITGMEALLRWMHPELGVISPEEFIPLAEETGLITSIGEWVLRTACRQNKSWQLAGFPPVSVAVNLSSIQFEQDDLVAIIEQVLRDTGMDPHFLELEITESIAIQNIDHVVEKLLTLRKMGIHISIDDFGTGYSSLSYLKRFPIDSLKIDKAFVRDITEDANIPTAIIAMAHRLSLSVTAEGVETNEQLELLRKLRCNFLQGYLFSEPLPAHEFEQLLAKGNMMVVS